MPALKAVATLLLAAAALVAAACGGRVAQPASGTGAVETFVDGHGPGGGPCLAELGVDGLRYIGPNKPGDPGGDLPAGAPIGTGTVRCHDRFAVEASTVAGVPPELAVHVVDGDERWLGVWVRDGYCVGGSDLRRCLLDVLELDGRSYAETTLSELEGISPQQIEFPRGASLGAGTVGPDGAAFTVIELAGVDPVIAVLIEGRPRSVFLALEANVTLDGTCYETAAAYVRCLQTRAGA